MEHHHRRGDAEHQAGQQLRTQQRVGRQVDDSGDEQQEGRLQGAGELVHFEHLGGPTRVSETGVLIGMCISFAVSTPFPWSVYENCHHHCRAVTVTFTTLPVGFLARLKMVATVGTAITARMSAGMTVQLISRTELPCTCLTARSSPGFSRNRSAT